MTISTYLINRAVEIKANRAASDAAQSSYKTRVAAELAFEGRTLSAATLADLLGCTRNYAQSVISSLLRQKAIEYVTRRSGANNPTTYRSVPKVEAIPGIRVTRHFMGDDQAYQPRKRPKAKPRHPDLLNYLFGRPVYSKGAAS